MMSKKKMMMKTQEKTPEIRESVQIPAVKQAGADNTKEEQNRKDEKQKELGCRKIFCRDFSFGGGGGAEKLESEILGERDCKIVY